MARKHLRSRDALEAVEEGRIQLARLQCEVKMLEDRCTAVTRNYTPKQGGTADVHSVLWDKLADKKELMALQALVLEQRERDVEHWIDLLPNARWRMLLRCRYLEGMDLQDVMQTLEKATGRPFTMSQIYNLHRQALEAAEGIWPI